MHRISIAFDKLQHIYDLHAKDFGLFASKSPEQLNRLKDALESHVSAKGTEPVPGYYRGQKSRLFYNPQTQLVVVANDIDFVVAAFKASSAQAAYINTTGRLN